MFEPHIIENIIQQSKKHQSKLTKEVLDLDGMSSPKIRHFLNNICAQKNIKYLEIGSWKGSTLCSALYNNYHIQATAIDNFSHHCDSTIKPILEKNIKTYLSNNNLVVINEDCFKLDLSLLNKFNVYFYDGAHDKLSQEKAITYFYPVLEDKFILIVDDFNNDSVRAGTDSGIKKMNLNIIKEWRLSAKNNGDIEQWWNGLFVAIMSK